MKNYFLTGFAAMIIAATTISATHSNSIVPSSTNTVYDTVPGSNPNNNNPNNTPNSTNPNSTNPNSTNPNSSNPSTNNPDRNNPNNNMDRKDSTTRMYDTSTMHRDSLLQR
jgi:hypothetical protein